MPKETSTANRRSVRSFTRASTISSQLSASSSNVDGGQGASSGAAPVTTPSTTVPDNVKTLVTDIVKSSMAELSRELKESLQPFLQREQAPVPQESTPPSIASNVMMTQHSPFTGMAPVATSLHSLGAQLPFQTMSANATSLEHPTTASAPASFSSFDGGFTPDVPASFVQNIQSGEFFDLSKLLPENFHSLAKKDNSYHLSMGEDSMLCFKQGKEPKKKIRDIESWTTAFTCYIRIIIDKFPARAKDLVAYLDLIRYAAAYHQSMGWLLYDENFRMKAANDKSVSWSRIDLQLWMRIFTVNQSKLLSDHSLFSEGPSPTPRGVATGRDGKCSNFNRGVPCAYYPCRFTHVCNFPGCGGSHPRTQCKQGGKPQLSLPASSTASPRPGPLAPPKR